MPLFGGYVPLLFPLPGCNHSSESNHSLGCTNAIGVPIIMVYPHAGCNHSSGCTPFPGCTPSQERTDEDDDDDEDVESSSPEHTQLRRDADGDFYMTGV